LENTPTQEGGIAANFVWEEKYEKKEKKRQKRGRKRKYKGNIKVKV
jgi:hypothetical protein